MTTSSNDNLISDIVKELLTKEVGLLRPIVQTSLQQLLEAQTNEAIGASKSKAI